MNAKIANCLEYTNSNTMKQNTSIEYYREHILRELIDQNIQSRHAQHHDHIDKNGNRFKVKIFYFFLIVSFLQFYGVAAYTQ